MRLIPNVRLIPNSIHARMLALSALATLVALVVAAFAISAVLERFVTATFDQQLDGKLFALASTVRRDGTIDRALVDRFDRDVARDETWRVDTPRGTAGTPGIGADSRAASLPALATIETRRHRRPEARPDNRRDGPPPPEGAPLPPGPGDPADATTPRPFDLALADGDRVHGRIVAVPTDAGPAQVAVAVPDDRIERPIREALAPLALSLLALGAALAIAIVVQLRYGLRPLRTIGAQVAAIRRGERARIDADQPRELQPLAVELNALAADTETALATARASAANLAHALKTPVATLALTLAQDADASAQVARIDATIRHHLARARTATGGTRAVTRLAPAIADLADAIARIHADRGVAITHTVADDLAVALDAHDLDELAGNLIDNAARHARARVHIAAVREDRRVRLTVTDDGPGIPPADRARATAPGTRLDERGDGHGFGLSIVRDLAALHGGTLSLDDAPTGGLAAGVTLPAA